MARLKDWSLKSGRTPCIEDGNGLRLIELPPYKLEEKLFVGLVPAVRILQKVF